MIPINGETQIVGFFGTTYKKSKMYAMYNAAFEALGLDYVYLPFVVKDLGKAVEGVRHLGIKAIGVTIPYKIDVLPHLDVLDRDAKRIGAANAILNRDGQLLGANTDGRGAVKAIQEVTTLAGKRVLLLGAGGAGRAVAFAIADAGGDVTIINRTTAIAEKLAGDIGCRFAEGDKLEEALQEAQIVVNATSIGMVPYEFTSLIKKELLAPNLCVMELVTNPKETVLLKAAKERGCSIVYGERMLLWQGALKFQLFTGMEAPIEVMEKALKNA